MLQDKLRDYEKQIQELSSRLTTVEREKNNYELKCGEMEKVGASECSSISCLKGMKIGDVDMYCQAMMLSESSAQKLCIQDYIRYYQLEVNKLTLCHCSRWCERGCTQCRYRR